MVSTRGDNKGQARGAKETGEKGGEAQGGRGEAASYLMLTVFSPNPPFLVTSANSIRDCRPSTIRDPKSGPGPRPVGGPTTRSQFRSDCSQAQRATIQVRLLTAASQLWLHPSAYGADTAKGKYAETAARTVW